MTLLISSDASEPLLASYLANSSETVDTHPLNLPIQPLLEEGGSPAAVLLIGVMGMGVMFFGLERIIKALRTNDK